MHTEVNLNSPDYEQSILCDVKSTRSECLPKSCTMPRTYGEPDVGECHRGSGSQGVQVQLLCMQAGGQCVCMRLRRRAGLCPRLCT